MTDIKIRSVLVSECYTNCYLCMNTDTKEGFIVDPGGDQLKISTNISDMGMKPTAILLTHGHFDHIGAVDALKQRYDIPVIAAEEEDMLLVDRRANLSIMFGEPITVCADRFLRDGENLTVAGITMKFILTPGHTKGSGCYYLAENEVLFSGDTLFHASRGRTDFPGGSEAAIIRSIKEKLLTLPGETEVYPGHMDMTTIHSEKMYY
ncbi:MAG: MBL fold metallo-hydrolase [Eubacterium sp.]|nr:MBL fold metallo-hydrolase [Eubacterium sp.]